MNINESFLHAWTIAANALIDDEISFEQIQKIESKYRHRFAAWYGNLNTQEKQSKITDFISDAEMPEVDPALEGLEKLFG